MDFKIEDLFKDGDGCFAELTTAGALCVNYKDGEVVSVTLNGKVFVPLKEPKNAD